MNKGELRALAVSYLKRSDFSAADFNAWCTFAASRLGRALRAQSNLVAVTLNAVANPVALPPDYRAMRSVEVGVSNGTFRLSVAEADLNSVPLSSQGGFPYAYRVEGLNMEVRPFSAVPLMVKYWNEPAALIDDSSTNAVLSAAPQVYLYAVLIEGAIWAMDAGAASGYVGVFNAEVEQLNLSGSYANAGDTPAMGG